MDFRLPRCRSTSIAVPLLLSIACNGPEAPPTPTELTVASDSAQTSEETEIEVDVLANDVGDGLTVTGVSALSAPAEALALPGSVQVRAGCIAQESLTYTVRDRHGATGSAPIEVAVIDAQRPSSPAALRLEAGAAPDTYRLSFEAPGDNGADSVCPVAGYQLEWSTVPSFDPSTASRWSAADAPGTAVQRDLSVPWGTPVYVRLRAEDEVGAGQAAAAMFNGRYSSRLVPAGRVDFGAVVVGALAQERFELTNTSTAIQLQVNGAQLSGAPAFALAGVPAGASVPPAGSWSFEVRFTPTTVGAASATLTVDTVAGPTSVDLVGLGRSPLELRDDAASIGEETTTQIDVLANDGPAGVELVELRGFFVGSATIGASGVTYQALTCADVTDTFGYRARLGPFTATASVTVEVRDTTPPEAITDLVGSLRGPGAAELRFTAPSENAPGAQCSPTHYALRWSTDPAMVATSSQSLAVGASVGSQEVLPVSGLSVAPIVYVELVAVDETGAEGPPQRPPLALDYRSARLSPAGPQVTLPSAAVGTIRAQPFTVTNDGVGSIEVSSVSLQGAAALALADPVSPRTLAPGASTEFVVHYAPTTTGTHTADLTVVTNAGPIGPVQLSASTRANRPPEITSRPQSRRILRPGELLDLGVVVQDEDGHLPTYDDIASVEVDLSALGGNTSTVALQTVTSTSPTTQQYAVGALDTTGLTPGGYVLPVRVVDRSGQEAWDAFTFAIYTGTERTVGAAGAYATPAAALAASRSGDAIVLLDAQYPGFSVSPPAGVDFVMGSNRPDGAAVTCSAPQSAPVLDFSSTGQTAQTVLIGMRFEQCTTPLRFQSAVASLLDLEFQGCSGLPQVGIVELTDSGFQQAGIRPARLVFGEPGPPPASYVAREPSYRLSCDFCTARVRHRDAYLLSLRDAHHLKVEGYDLSMWANSIAGAAEFAPSRDVVVERSRWVRLNGVADLTLRDVDGVSLTHCHDVHATGDGGRTIGPGSHMLFEGGQQGFVVQGVSDLHLRNIDAIAGRPLIRSTFFGYNVLIEGCRGQSVYEGRSAIVENLTLAGNQWSTALFVADEFTSGPITSRGRFEVRDSIIADVAPVMFDVSRLMFVRPQVTNVLLPTAFNPSVQVLDSFPGLNSGRGLDCGPADGNQCGDPLFAPGPRSAYYLGSGSPAIDAGSETAAAARLDDQTTRPSGQLDQGILDLGAHYRP